MDCNGNAMSIGKEWEDGVGFNIRRNSLIEDLEFGTGIPKELLEGPGPEFPESDQALLHNLAVRFVLHLFEDFAETMEPVSSQDFLKKEVLGESKTTSPRPSVATLVEGTKADGTSDNFWSTNDVGKDSNGILLEEKGGISLVALPFFPELKPLNGTEPETVNSSQHELRSKNLKPKSESASGISSGNDLRNTPNISEGSVLESANENKAMLPGKQMECPPQKERKRKVNFFQKLGHRLHSRSSEKIPNVSFEDITGASKADADIMAAKKSDPEEGSAAAAKRELEWFETPVSSSSDLNFDDPIHRPLMPAPLKPRSRFRRFMDIFMPTNLTNSRGY